MAFITADRVKDTSTTTGTGNITVSGSAPFGYRTFSTVLSVSDTFYYAIQGQSTSEWEVGLGTYVSSNQFSRTTVLASSASGSAVSFSSGTKNVFITLPATKTFQLDPSQSLVPGAVLYGTGNSTVGYTAAGTGGQVLTSNAAGAPTWNTVSGTGTVTSVAVSGGSTGLTTSGGPITGSGTITMAGTLAVASGGTGLTSTPANGALDIGNGTGFTRANLTAGANITITNTAGGISIAASGAGTPNTIANGTSSVGIASSNGSVVAVTNGTTALTIDTSQNVGIGTASPTRKLDVNGDASINTVRVGLGPSSVATNTVVGYQTGNSITTAAKQVCVGYQAGYSNLSSTGSTGNVMVGWQAGYSNTGPDNTYIGGYAGGDATSGGGNVAIGFYAGSSNALSIFNLAANSDRIVIGSTNTSNAYVKVAWTVTSDARDKTDVENSPYGLNFVSALRPVTFKWDERCNYEDGISDGSKKKDKAQLGFLAQEVISVEKLFGASSKAFLIADDEEDERLKITETKFIPVLVKAIQELSAKNDALEARLAALEAK